MKNRYLAEPRRRGFANRVVIRDGAFLEVSAPLWTKLVQSAWHTFQEGLAFRGDCQLTGISGT